MNKKEWLKKLCFHLKLCFYKVTLHQWTAIHIYAHIFHIVYIDKTFIKSLRYEYESLKYESRQMCIHGDYFARNRG